MEINTDLIAFTEWAIKMGCPPHLVPSYAAMQSSLRARSSIVMDMVEKVRSRAEVQRLRNNILINRMQKLRDKDLPISVRSFVPAQYQRYDRIEEATRKINETTEKLDRIKIQTTKLMGKIQEKNIKKMKLKKSYEDALTKHKLLEAKLMSLFDEVAKIRRNEEELRHMKIVLPCTENSEDDKSFVALQKCKSQLDEFYNGSEANSSQDACALTKSQVMEGIRSTVEDFSNLMLYRTVHKLMETELKSLSCKDLPKGQSQRSVSNDEQFSRSISDAYQRFIHRSTQLKAEIESLHCLEENYEELYSSFTEKMDQSFCGIEEPLKEDFINESVRSHFNDGRIRFVQSEIMRNKELVREREHKLKHMNDISESVRDVFKKCQSGIYSMVGDMKQLQKIKAQLLHMRDLTEKHMCMIRGEFLPCSRLDGRFKRNSGKSMFAREGSSDLEVGCSRESKDDLTMVDELKLFGDMPMVYLNHLDYGQMWRRSCPIYYYNSEMIRTSKYAHLLTAQGFLKEVWGVCAAQARLKKLNKKRDFSMTAIRVDMEEIKRKEQERADAILTVFRTMDGDLEIIDSLMERCKVYYDFLMTCPLKNYISNALKVDGKTFTAMENEYLLYYRMIKGTDHVFETMDC